jgi:hypothetical protein
MIYDIFTGFPNKVEGSQIYVRDVNEEYINLMIMREDNSAPSSDWYLVGDLIEIAGAVYELTEVFEVTPTESYSPPGAGSGQLVARIRLGN